MISVRQARMLRAIVDYHKMHGFSPSMRDLMRMANISSASVVTYNRDRLAEMGYLTFHHELARSFQVTVEGLAALREVGG